MEDRITKDRYSCPNCGGRMQWDISKQAFCCVSCRTEKEVEQEEPKEWEHPLEDYAARLGEEPVLEEQSMVCKGCGATTLFEAHETAKVCPMCGSVQISAEKQATGICPDGVVPFQVDKHNAQEGFRKWVKTRWFAPNKLKRAYQEGNLQGLYVPFWTFDIEASADYKGKGGTEYTVEDSDGDWETKVRWENVKGHVKGSYDDVPVCASKNEVAEIIDDILPFSTGESRPYDTAYLSGFQAEHYVVAPDEAAKTAREFVESDLKDKAEEDIKHDGYDEADVKQLDTEYTSEYYKQVLLPVWFSTFFYKNKQYMYLINGETGEVGGKRPYSVLKITLAILVALAIVIVAVVLFSSDAEAAVQTGTYMKEITTGSLERGVHYGMVWTR